MKPIGRIILLLVIAAAILVGAGIAARELTGSPWWPLAVVSVVALMLGRIVDEALHYGIHLGKQDAKQNDRDDVRQAIIQALGKVGLRPTSMHRVGDFDPDGHGHDHDYDEDEVAEKLQAIDEVLTDGDLREMSFHVAHVATGCPGTNAHMARLLEVITNVETRLRDSKLPPQNDTERPTIH